MELNTGVANLILSSGILAMVIPLVWKGLKATDKVITALSKVIEGADTFKRNSNNVFVRETLEMLMRSADEMLNGYDGDKKRDWVIAKAQFIIPDNILRDADIRSELEAIWNKIGEELKSKRKIV